MKNMNIQYECLDTRDDFHAQMKKGALSFPGGHDDPFYPSLNETVIEDFTGTPNDPFTNVAISTTKGRNEMSRPDLLSDEIHP